MPLQLSSVDLINQKQVMRLVGVGSRETLDRWIRLGLFPPPIRIGVGRLRWVVAEVETWVEAKKLERAPSGGFPVAASATGRQAARQPAERNPSQRHA